LTTQIVIAGTGGQGILFAARLLQQAAVDAGFDIIGSETHGMSQRGGSVVAHLKIGTAKSPLVRRGCADILYCLHPDETVTNLPFLKSGGVCFANASDTVIPEKLAKTLARKKILLYTIDADRIAASIANPLSANLVLIGFSMNTNLLPFSLDHLRGAVGRAGQERFREGNLAAIESGLAAWKFSRRL
jgi:indolepyruvate ferredoxin oxidoreductase beta subunit